MSAAAPTPGFESDVMFMPPLSPDGEQSRAQLARLRELRAEAQDLQSALDSVRRGETTIKHYAAYIRKTVLDIQELLAVIRDGDTIRHLQNCWEQMMVNPLLATPDVACEAQQQLHYLDMLDGQLRRIVFLTGYLTIPERVNQWLAQARPGYYIPFHLVFDDELPLREDRVRVLNYLAWSPQAIRGGIVDAANGLIYRYAEQRRSRVYSFLQIIFAFLICTGVVIGACYVRVPGWPIQSTQLYSFLVGWGAVLAGIVTHIAVSGVKRAQGEGGLPPVIAVGDLSLIINARVGHILLKLLLALIGFFGVVFASGANGVTLLNTFLLGYSLDSFIELFSASVEQRATAQVAALKKQLGVTVPS